MPRSTYRPAPRGAAIRYRLRINWREVLAAGTVAALTFALTLAILGLATSQPGTPADIPRCTDAIADTGGACVGGIVMRDGVADVMP